MKDPEGREETIEEWIANNRAMWIIVEPAIPYFAGIWKVADDWEEAADKMYMEGLPDWPMEHPDHVEVHKIPIGDRPDKYQPEQYREYAFREVMAIRPVEKPIEREQIGKVTMLRLDQDEKITHLVLSGRFSPE